MKLCTLLKFDETGENVTDASFSFVEDGHTFGWVDGELHIEATYQVIERGTTDVQLPDTRPSGPTSRDDVSRE